jgi:hypothetical protein
MRVDHVDRTKPEVFAWRRRQLVAAGFEPGLAARLARDGAYDLHSLIELAERGCPPDLAVRILAPLDERKRV